MGTVQSVLKGKSGVRFQQNQARKHHSAIQSSSLRLFARFQRASATTVKPVNNETVINHMDDQTSESSSLVALKNIVRPTTVPRTMNEIIRELQD
ncbi:hypothetical protein [Synechococcus sp. UW179A]|uniref:hypothetical protein n=1 Tax=Synechococcus sp. UW179A TaxID=2575510 RepID=UPI000E0E5F51|nr:hypothetical protein [Synechococcus sp. UW179A]